MSGEYEMKEPILKKYHSIAVQLLTGFDKVQAKQLSIKDNSEANVLSKLASSVIIEQRGNILLEFWDVSSYDMPQIFNLSQEEPWMTIIILTLQGDKNHLDKKELAKSQYKATRYDIITYIWNAY